MFDKNIDWRAFLTINHLSLHQPFQGIDGGHGSGVRPFQPVGTGPDTVRISSQ